MPIALRILTIVVCGLIVVNAVLAWHVWLALPHAATSITATATAQRVMARARPTTITATCRAHIKAYLELSNARMYMFFQLHDQLTASNAGALADQVYALSKDYAALPESCPATLDGALHANYLSVYSSAPIHLHRYFRTATAFPKETINQRLAWRLFEREADTAEQSMYQLLRLIQ